MYARSEFRVQSLESRDWRSGSIPKFVTILAVELLRPTKNLTIKPEPFADFLAIERYVTRQIL